MGNRYHIFIDFTISKQLKTKWKELYGENSKSANWDTFIVGKTKAFKFVNKIRRMFIDNTKANIRHVREQDKKDRQKRG